ncbi:MAG: UDP-N-acetylglucosamine 4,6-dehydratase [Deltaproteobacteria bacterium GWC2_55_46]|nr:MAG: UDP-N-acetylglucosamine 4,6-dehydratase [Deltaproteobacteria bacterium GWA2_55_82]OGQ63578.1 MAG: UDP-N-acetylglucosamine 4,6-dehydratase [Deltaproteobacteria bacterium RIFCSPLOWO2_02_FULL_55_12]OIJ75175.1 MAG: UDP-N-acetylglucosamine 4,6-dehydratase [Deltaproteobacteria bacterium GWC2_55_46]
MKNLLQPSRFKKVLLFIVLDVLTTILSLYLAFLFRFDFVFPPGYSGLFAVSLPFFAVLRLIVFTWSNIYRITWRYVGVRDLYDIVTASAVAQLAIIALVYVLLPALFIDLSGFKEFPRGIFLIDGVLFVILTATLRVSKRVFLEVIGRKRQAKYGEKTLILGAGNMGELILRDMIKQNFSIFHPVGFLDDDEKLVGTYIHGVRILGKIESLKAFVRQHRVETIIIAIPSLNFRVLRKIYEAAREAKVKNVKTIPRIYDFNRPEVSLKSLEEIRVEDLLGRQTVKVDCDNNRQLLARKSIFVTGAGGSIGSELVRQICAFDPEKVVLLDNNETALHDMEVHLKRAYPHFFRSRAGCSLNDRVSFIVGDIRDRESVARAFRTYRADIVFHSAAYKHVPMMEYNPAEAVKVNILGSHIVAKTAIECGVEKFILISTDKAVRPTSVMGATKRIAEHICKASNGRGTVFVSVRFGNVLGSRGSILPLFMEQLRNGGPLTVTHRDMKRYFMTIPEAVSLVLQASVIGKAEDVLVLDMGEPVSILSLAEELIRLNGLQPYKDVDINFIGLRPGENLFENLLTAEEGTVATDHEKIFVAKSSESYSMHEIESILEEFESTVSGPFTDHQKITDTLRKYVKQFEISQKTCMEKI